MEIIHKPRACLIFHFSWFYVELLSQPNLVREGWVFDKGTSCCLVKCSVDLHQSFCDYLITVLRSNSSDWHTIVMKPPCFRSVLVWRALCTQMYNVSTSSDILKFRMFISPSFSPGVGAASSGKLTFMVGGVEEEFTAAQELLTCMGANVVYCGAVGTGQVVIHIYMTCLKWPPGEISVKCLFTKSVQGFKPATFLLLTQCS